MIKDGAHDGVRGNCICFYVYCARQRGDPKLLCTLLMCILPFFLTNHVSVSYTDGEVALFLLAGTKAVLQLQDDVKVVLQLQDVIRGKEAVVPRCLLLVNLLVQVLGQWSAKLLVKK